MATSARLGCGSVTVEASPVHSITAGGDGAVGFHPGVGDCLPWAGGPRPTLPVVVLG